MPSPVNLHPIAVVSLSRRFRMTRTISVCLLAITLAASPALAQKKAKTKAPQSYDATFVMNGTTYTGTMTLTFTGTAVTGSMNITDPVAVDGTVAGTLKSGELSLDYAFTVHNDQPCTGRVAVTAKMAPDRSTATGHAQSSGCGDDAGDFSIKKSAAPAKQ
jgi:hypothetical protein